MGEFLRNNWFWIALLVFFFWMHRSGAGCGGGHGGGHQSGGGGGCGGHAGHTGYGDSETGGGPKEEETKSLPAGGSHRH
ncbi:MAG: hypothetical protein HZB55_12120 [Deltaproteobacteria bacterium]|nr:hypothetical protein [Deltaproteobacteria bacterium]